MNKLHHFILPGLFIIGSAYAVNFGIGIKGGGSIHEFHLTFSPDRNPLTTTYAYRMGPTLWLFGELIHNKYIGQQLCLGYYQSGGSLEMKEVDVDTTDGSITMAGTGHNIIKLDNLSVAYAVKLRYELNMVTPYVMLGIQYDYLINHDDIYESSKGETKIFHNFTYSQLNKSNVTPIMGIGAAYRLKVGMIFFEYFPFFHLLPVYEHKATDYNLGARYTTNGHIMNIGYEFVF